MPIYKAPGVYATEFDAFPTAIVGVATAIPAFIGYTEKAALAGKPVTLTPIKINSLAEYEETFGAGFHSAFDIEPVPVDGKPNPADYDFICQRQSTDSPPVWTTTYYKFTAVAGFNLYNALRLFYANGGGACYIVSVGPCGDGKTTATVTFEQLDKGLDAIRAQSGPTMLVIPDAVLLPPANHDGGVPVSPDFGQLCKNMLAQCNDLTDRVAILDIYGAGMLDHNDASWETSMTTLIDSFQTGVGDSFLNYGMAYFPFLKTTLIQPQDIDYANINIQDLAQADLLQAILDDQAEVLFTGDQRAAVKASIAEIRTTDSADKAAVASLNTILVGEIPLLKQMEEIIAVKSSLMPTAPAMAGIFTFVDNSRGVWNAPANTALNSVVAPNVTLNDEQQGNLNVPINGKAVNVIRQIVGRGPVVWGARTLDGNSNDYRYIQVRRTLIYIEQSIEQALQPFVFAANDGKTWVAVSAMVSNFLHGLWLQGGLMGDKASDAFTVSCGLGSTMTPSDILEGYMIVQVTLQMIRPAEFIELTFKQKMQGIG